MSLADRLKGIKVPTTIKSDSGASPVWDGPEANTKNGGITFSLISRFLTCRERFRLYASEGLRPAKQFNHRVEYGNMWHACAEAQLAKKPWKVALHDYAQMLLRSHKTEAEAIDKWQNVCAVQFPLYDKYWSEHPDVASRIPLFQERVFNVPYRLPSGRLVYLRGKKDGIDLVDSGRASKMIYLYEHKTKSDINEQKVHRQLKFDMQTMMYLVALRKWKGQLAAAPKGSLDKASKVIVDHKIGGVIYNVVRRPLSGGKGTIVQHKPSKSNPMGETKSSYYKRLSGIIEESSDYFFMRWKVDVTEFDIDRFENRTLIPLLETICVWYDTAVKKLDIHIPPYQLVRMMNWQHPFGVVNYIDESGYSDMDEFLDNGSEVGLERESDLFPELE